MAVVVKDAGDDPDVTHGARLTATVRWRGEPGLELDGGVGVGVVTKPGLGLELGGPAINPVPRAMITQAVGEAVDLSKNGITRHHLGPGRRADGAQDHQRQARHHRRHLDPRHHRHRPAVLHRVLAGQRGAGDLGAGRPGRGHGGAVHRRPHREGRHEAPPAACRRCASWRWATSPAPRCAGRPSTDLEPRRLRRHGGQAHQAGRGRADDPLHAVQGGPGPAGRHHASRRRPRGPGRADRQRQHRPARGRTLGPGRPAPGGRPRAVRPRRPRAEPVQRRDSRPGTEPPQVRVIMVDFTGQQKIAEAAA